MAISFVDVIGFFKELISDPEKLNKFKEIIADIKELIADIKDVIATFKWLAYILRIMVLDEPI